MQILFVCQSNTFRSVAAEYYFNNLSKKHRAISAGLKANKFPGQKIGEAVKDYPEADSIWSKLDISRFMYDKIPKKLNQEMVETSGKIIILLEDKSLIPDYLAKLNKVEFWKIQDGVTGSGKLKSLSTHKKIVKQIKNKIIELITQLD